jgi:hypothetical protein
VKKIKTKKSDEKPMSAQAVIYLYWSKKMSSQSTYNGIRQKKRRPKDMAESMENGWFPSDG